MSNLDIIRAWKDEHYRETLSTGEQAQLPENPAGVIELDDAELDSVNAGSIFYSLIVFPDTLTCLSI